jgi:hypothetical protein
MAQLGGGPEAGVADGVSGEHAGFITAEFATLHAS